MIELGSGGAYTQKSWIWGRQEVRTGGRTELTTALTQSEFWLAVVELHWLMPVMMLRSSAQYRLRIFTHPRGPSLVSTL